MNRILTYALHLLIASLTTVLLQGCKHDFEYTKPVQIRLQLLVDSDVIPFEVSFEQSIITLINKTNNEKYSAPSSSAGLVDFSNMTPGLYAINVSLSIPAAEFSAQTGLFTEDDVQLNYSAENLNFRDDTQTDIPLVSSKAIGNWVFKQIYYAGSHNTNGASFRDLFVEIYNNSNEVLYADSLVFAVAFGKANNNPGEFLLPNLQYDWTHALGMNSPGDANRDYLYAKALFMIPSNATGTRYPTAPGESFIIAGSAIDHTKPYTLNSDKEQTIKDANLTIDLSKADFEVYLYPYEQKIEPGRTKFASDIDNPSVTDVETIFATGMRDLILNAAGKDSYALLKFSPDVDINQLPQYMEPTKRVVTTNSTFYPQLPNQYVIDAVEIAAVIEKDNAPRRLPLALDAGAKSVLSGTYSSQSIVRKTKRIINNRRILQDTNNSINDFGVKTKADPSKSSNSFIDE